MKRIIILLSILVSLLLCSSIYFSYQSWYWKHNHDFWMMQAKINSGEEKLLGMDDTVENIRLSFIYKDECVQEIDNKYKLVDDIVKSMTSITTEQAQILAQRVGISDKNNYIIDKDILIKECIDKKKEIYNQ
jgi:hypothetical protein